MDIKWIKLSTDVFNHRKIKMMEQMPNGDTIILIWLKLLVLASEINDGGMVYLTKSVPFTTKILTNVIGRPEEIVVTALATFKDYGMITIDDQGYIFIINWEKYQSVDKMMEIREYNRLAKQRQRAKEREKMEDTICQYCGAEATGYDHIIPKAFGGTDDNSNLVPCCPTCNKMKSVMPLTKFLNSNLSRIDINKVLANDKLTKFVVYDGARFIDVNDSQMNVKQDSQTNVNTDKNRKEKNRRDKKYLYSAISERDNNWDQIQANLPDPLEGDTE